MKFFFNKHVQFIEKLYLKLLYLSLWDHLPPQSLEQCRQTSRLQCVRVFVEVGAHSEGTLLADCATAVTGNGRCTQLSL